jgi:hypothetical protein
MSGNAGQTHAQIRDMAHWTTFSLAREKFALGTARRADGTFFSLAREKFALGTARRAHRSAAIIQPAIERPAAAEPGADGAPCCLRRCCSSGRAS